MTTIQTHWKLPWEWEMNNNGHLNASLKLFHNGPILAMPQDVRKYKTKSMHQDMHVEECFSNIKMIIGKQSPSFKSYE